MRSTDNAANADTQLNQGSIMKRLITNWNVCLATAIREADENNESNSDSTSDLRRSRELFFQSEISKFGTKRRLHESDDGSNSTKLHKDGVQQLGGEFSEDENADDMDFLNRTKSIHESPEWLQRCTDWNRKASKITKRQPRKNWRRRQGNYFVQANNRCLRLICSAKIKKESLYVYLNSHHSFMNTLRPVFIHKTFNDKTFKSFFLDTVLSPLLHLNASFIFLSILSCRVFPALLVALNDTCSWRTVGRWGFHSHASVKCFLEADIHCMARAGEFWKHLDADVQTFSEMDADIQV